MGGGMRLPARVRRRTYMHVHAHAQRAEHEVKMIYAVYCLMLKKLFAYNNDAASSMSAFYGSMKVLSSFICSRFACFCVSHLAQ
jgi:hypothetical protein